MDMNQFLFLFTEKDNGYGYYNKRTYFLCDKEITQEMANKFILSANHAAERIGSSFEDFKKGAELNGFTVNELKLQYIDNITGTY